MTIVDVIKSALAWQITPSEPPVIAEPLPPAVLRERPEWANLHRLEREFLTLTNLPSFEYGEACVPERIRGHLPPGRIRSVRDKNGNVVDLRVVHYGTHIEAAVDFTLVQLEDECESAGLLVEQRRADKPLDAAKIATMESVRDRAQARLDRVRYLSPLGVRYAMRRDLAGLAAPKSLAPSPQGYRPIPPPAPPSIASSEPYGPDENIRAMRVRRAEIEEEHRVADRTRLAVRQQAAIDGLRVPDLEDSTGERVRLETKLREWVLLNPDLADELARP